MRALMVVNRSKVDMVRQEMRHLSAMRLVSDEWTYIVVPTVAEARVHAADDPAPECVVISLDVEDAEGEYLLREVLPSFSGHVVFASPKRPSKKTVSFLETAREAGYDRVLYDLPGNPPYSIVDALNEAAGGGSVSVESDWAAKLAGGGTRPEGVRSRGIVLILVSPKGGSGKTTIAVNLAEALAGQRSVALWDCNFGHPGCAVHFNLTVRSGIEGLADLPKVTKEAVRDCLLHTKSLSVLPGPSTDYIGRGRFQVCSETFWIDVLDALQEMHDVTVIDTRDDLDDPAVVNLCRMADRVYVVEDQSKYTEIETARQAPKLSAIGVMPERIRIIVNKYIPSGHKEREILATFNKGYDRGTPHNLLPRVAAVLAENYRTYLEAQWQGKAVSVGSEQIARQWQALLQDAVPEASVYTPPRRGWLGRRH